MLSNQFFTFSYHNYGSADVHIGHRKSATSEPDGTSVNRRQIADVVVVKIVVLLRPPNFHNHRGGWLASNLTFFSAVFLGAVS